MQHRTLGKTGFEVSAISFGAWAIGGSWGEVDDRTSLAALRRAKAPVAARSRKSGTAGRVSSRAKTMSDAKPAPMRAPVGDKQPAAARSRPCHRPLDCSPHGPETRSVSSRRFFLMSP